MIIINLLMIFYRINYASAIIYICKERIKLDSIMRKNERASLKERILTLIAEGEKEIAMLKEHTKPVSPENSLGRISRMDAINNKSVAEASMRIKTAKLTKLRIALTHIDNEDFGVCKMCNNTIQAARLMYMPESTRCVRCASR